jgi:hypothetical protein
MDAVVVVFVVLSDPIDFNCDEREGVTDIFSAGNSFTDISFTDISFTDISFTDISFTDISFVKEINDHSSIGFRENGQFSQENS